MNWLSMFLQLLPTIVVAVENVGSALAGHQKKAAVQAGLTAIAQGVSVVVPQHATAAVSAAQVASQTIDGVVKVLNDAGVLQPHTNAAPAPVAVPSPTPTVARTFVDAEAAAEVQPGPGLHIANAE
jgi:hypothetical protein